jgi:hypothetical protein
MSPQELEKLLGGMREAEQGLAASIWTQVDHPPYGSTEAWEGSNGFWRYFVAKARWADRDIHRATATKDDWTLHCSEALAERIFRFARASLEKDHG